MPDRLTGKLLDADEYALRHDDELGFEASLIGARQNCNVRLLGRYPAQTILEVGCGPSLLISRAVAAGVAFDRWAIIEPASTYFNTAIIYSQIESRLHVVQGYLEHEVDSLLEASRSGYDTVLLSGVMHETARPKLLLRAAISLLRPGGHVHITVPNGLSFHRLLAVKMNLIPHATTLSERNRELGQPLVFTPSSLRQLVEREGLVDVQLQGYFFKPFTSKQLEFISRQFGQEIIRGMEELGRDFPEYAAEICISARKA